MPQAQTDLEAAIIKPLAELTKPWGNDGAISDKSTWTTAGEIGQYVIGTGSTASNLNSITSITGSANTGENLTNARAAWSSFSDPRTDPDYGMYKGVARHLLSVTNPFAPYYVNLRDPITGEDNTYTTYMTASHTLSSHKSSASYELDVAWGHSVHTYGYIGAQAFFELSPGTATIQSSASAVPISSYNIITTSGGTLNDIKMSFYDSTSENAVSLPLIQEQITMKKKYAFGAGIKLGFTVGNCLLYIPFNISMTKYSSNFNRDTNAIAQYDSTTFWPKSLPSNATSGVVSSVENVIAGSPSSYVAPAVGDTIDFRQGYSYPKLTNITGANTTANLPAAGNYTKSSTKFGYSFGFGILASLTDKVSVGLCYTYAPRTKMNVTTPAYASNVLYDQTRLGRTHTFRICDNKITLSFAYSI